jgi:iron-sulfur cluster assembly protein
MIKVTPAAARQIQIAAAGSGAQDMLLRVAAQRAENGEFQYGMGFDTERDNDTRVESEGVSLLVGESSRELLSGAILDYVEINPGEHRFIFTNPNDPAHRAPQNPS